MHDPGSYNYFVGHRRWILYPQTKEMGTGDIPYANGYPGANALWGFDDNIFGTTSIKFLISCFSRKYLHSTYYDLLNRFWNGGIMDISTNWRKVEAWVSYLTNKALGADPAFTMEAIVGAEFNFAGFTPPLN